MIQEKKMLKIQDKKTDRFRERIFVHRFRSILIVKRIEGDHGTVAFTVVQRKTPERAPNKSLFHAHLYDPGRFKNYHTVPLLHDKLVRRQIVLAFSLRHDIFNFCFGNVNAVIVVNEAGCVEKNITRHQLTFVNTWHIW